jgi:transposase
LRLADQAHCTSVVFNQGAPLRESDPAKLAALAGPGIRSKLREAMAGRIRRHHRFMLRIHRQQIAALDAAIAEIDRDVDANLTPFRASIELLTSIPGISTLSAQVIISEIGTDMSRFPTAAHLI